MAVSDSQKGVSGYNEVLRETEFLGSLFLVIQPAVWAQQVPAL